MRPWKLPPKPTPPPAPLTESFVDQQLETMTTALSEALARAKAIDPAQDEYGHRASAEVSQALKFAEMSARLVKAKARLNGEIKLLHHVTRGEASAAQNTSNEPDVYPGMPKMTDEEMNTVEGYFHFERRWLTAKLRFLGEDMASVRERLEEMRRQDERDQLLEIINGPKTEATPSPLASGGSNGQADG